jgi:hypothetical protein
VAEYTKPEADLLHREDGHFSDMECGGRAQRRHRFGTKASKKEPVPQGIRCSNSKAAWRFALSAELPQNPSSDPYLTPI